MDKSAPSKESLERARKFLDEQLELRSPMHSWLESLALEFDTIRRERDEVAEKLAKAVNTYYPTIAGRVIQLQEAGEEKAAAEWNEVATAFYTALAAYRESMGR